MRFRLEVPASGKIPSANYLAKIIIVINNNINVSRFNGTVPDNPTQNRKIRGGPIYAKDEVLLLCQKNKLELWTDESISDSQKWGMDLPGIATLIASAVQRGTFKCSEWCIRAAKGPWAACDVYTITQFEWNPFAMKELPTRYYVKFAVSRTGQMLLTVSNHPEGT